MGLKNKQRQSGFTFIEMLIVVAIISIIIPALFALFFAHVRAQSKVFQLQQVKENGDSALGIMETLIKDGAISIHSASPPTSGNEVCATASSSYSGTLYFLDRSSTYFSFALSSGKIASSSSAMGTTVNLTNSKSTISSLAISCSRSSTYAEPLVSISFTVSQNGSGSRPTIRII
jgi:prepilin-type N-terminal cleavage/methylation domain-containing protein